MPVFKKRPKHFFGTRRQDLPHKSHHPRSSVIERPVPIECSASSKKLALSPQYPLIVGAGSSLRSSSHPRTFSASCESLDHVGEMKGYRLVSCERLSGAVGETAVYSLCASPLTVKENLVVRRGLVSKLMIVCTNTACRKEAVVSDPYASDAKSLNTIGRGRNGLESFCGIMDMLPPLSTPAYSDHNHHLAKISMECARENMRAVSAHLHQLHGVPFDKIIDVIVTCDGTWSKHGFTATYGVVAVISWETGQVLDYEIKSKHCNACSRKLQSMEETSEEFMDWWKAHKSVCEVNHKGSSPAMEAAAALDIWKRSEEHLHLRFTEVISDGDSKTIAMLQESRPYGENVVISKYECVGHVQKRVGKHLRKAKRKIAALNKVARQKLKELQEKEKEKKKQEKAKEKLERKAKGKQKRRKRKEAANEGKKDEVVDKGKKEEEVEVIKGVFSDKTIDLLQTYYGNAIRSHIGDLEGMERACWAVFYHSISTNDNPQHHCCPHGADSWCKYQRAIALQQVVPPHTPRIPADFEPFIKPVFEQVCNEELLKKCLKGATQNQNESFNSLIWIRSPKTEYSSLATTQIAVSHATLVFNSGKKALVSVMKGVGIHAGPLCSAYLSACDSYRVQRSLAKGKGVAKKKRKMKRLVEKSVEEEHIQKEGVSYEAGGF